MLEKKVIALTSPRLPWLLALFFALIVGACSVARVWRGGAGTSDLSIFHSALLGTVIHGDFYFTALHPKGPLLYQHFDPVVFLLLPFYWIFKGSAWVVLPLSMTIAAALAIPAAARFGRNEGLSPRKSLIIPILLLFNVSMHNIVWYDFHPFVFALPLLLWGWVWIREGRSFAGSVCWVAAILCKENVSLTVAGLGLVLALKGRRRFGLAWFIAGMLAFVSIAAWIMPAFREIGEGSPYLNCYGWMGQTPGEIIRTLLLRPVFVLDHVFSQPSSWRLLWRLSLPFAFLFLLAPKYWPAMIPELAILFLSDFDPMHSVKYHYTAIILGILILASIEGFARLNNLVESRRRWISFAAIGAGFLFSLIFLKSDGRTFPFLDLPRQMEYYEREKRREQIDEIAALIPEEASISLPYTLLNPRYPFIERRLIAFIPDQIDFADYIIFDERTKAYGGWKDKGMDEAIIRLRSSPEHELVYDDKKFLVFHRKQRVIDDPNEYFQAWSERGSAG